MKNLYNKENLQQTVSRGDYVSSLVVRFQQGEEHLKEEILQSCTPLIKSIAFKYLKYLTHLKFEDLFQEGCIGLLKAMEKYDVNRGAFSTIATQCIRHEILDAIDKLEKAIRLPDEYNTYLRKYNSLFIECQKKNIPMPSDEELCRLLDVSIKKLKHIQAEFQKTVVSIHTPLDGEGMELQDVLLDSFNVEANFIENENMRQMLLVLKNYLKPSYYYMLFHFKLSNPDYGQVTYRSMAPRFHSKFQSVEQQYKSALKKSRECLGNPKIFHSVWKELLNTYGKNIYQLNLFPIQLEDILKFLYLQPYLTEMEMKYYYTLYVRRENFSVKDLASFFHISFQEVLKFQKQIEQKLNILSQNPKDYQTVCEANLDSYQISILNKKI